jgi:hypothetical protein
MLSPEDMPEDNADLANVKVEFPKLQLDSPTACPVPFHEVVDYLKMETADGDTIAPSQLKFLRTAQVADRDYWIWSFTESDGTECYVTVSLSPGQGPCIGYEENHYGLTPAQFILGDFRHFVGIGGSRIQGLRRPFRTKTRPASAHRGSQHAAVLGPGKGSLASSAAYAALAGSSAPRLAFGVGDGRTGLRRGLRTPGGLYA